jgi:phosphoglycerate dehydrogenase-like enzyme
VLKVYYPVDPPSQSHQEEMAAWDLLKTRLDPQVELITGEKLPDQADYQILVNGRPTPEQLNASPALHTLIIPWAGLSTSTGELIQQYPHLAVHNLHYNAVTTAESALMLLLTAAKLILPVERQFRKNDWRPRYLNPNPSLMLSGKTVLILGYGSIGQHLGKACKAMGMRVMATRRSLQRAKIGDQYAEVYPASELHRLLPQANVLIITLPLTDETQSLIGEAELELLPEKAILVNVGRGPIVDQEALYHALKNGYLHSAGLDVWYHYPPDEESRANTPPADFPFHELDNVVMSPHRGGGSSDSKSLRMEHLAEILNLAVQGQPLPNKVEPERGY